MRAVAQYYKMRHFDPFDAAVYPTPLHAVWASDPAWSNPGDGGAVSSWRNASAGGDPAQGTAANKPTFRASVAALNGRAAVQFDGGDSLSFDIADQAQPVKLLAVVQSTDLSTSQSAIAIGASGRLGVSTTGPNWILNAGTGLLGTGGANTNPHILRATANGASSALYRDGTSIGGTTDAGTGAVTSFVVGGNVPLTNMWVGYVAFAAVYAGSVTDAALVILERALGSFYGITVA